MRKRLRKIRFNISIAQLALISLLVYATFPISHKIVLIKSASISPYDRYDYLLFRPLITKVDNEFITVPALFKTDLASIPRALWSFMAPNTAHFVYPSILHDYLYTYPATHSRIWCDEVFYSYLLERGVSPLKAYQIYIAVRIFGGSHFANKGNG